MGILAAAVLIYQLSTLILLFFLGCMLSVVLNPVCRKLESFGLKRKYAVAVIALGLFSVLVTLATFLIPAITGQLVNLINSLPEIRADFLNKIPNDVDFKPVIEELLSSPKIPDSSSVMSHALTIIAGATSILTAFSLIWIFSVYLLADGRRAFVWFSDFFSAPTRLKLNATATETSQVVAAFAKAQFITGITCAFFCYCVLTFLNIPAALTLATIAGLFDIVPIVGFFIALIPAIFISYLVSPSIALIVIVSYGIYHMIENYLIIPSVYGTRMKVSGLVVLLALLVGTVVGGILLALAILPIIASYPIIERIWLVKYLGRDVVDRHAKTIENRPVSDQVKMWDVSRVNIQRSTTLTNRDLSRHFKRKVLIVEDDPDIRALLQDILETEGYHAFIASNGNEALTTLESVDGIGLVLMDINMPVMDGRRVFEIMKTIPEFAAIPVVFLSANEVEPNLDGSAGVLKKPSPLEEIIRTVEKLYQH